MKINFICDTCKYYNRSNFDMVSFEFKEESFICLVDLLNHWNKNKDHQVDIVIESENENED